MASEKASCNAEATLIPAREKRKRQKKKRKALCNNDDKSHDSSESGLTEAQCNLKLNYQPKKRTRSRSKKRRRLNGMKNDNKDVHLPEVTSEPSTAPSGTKALHVSLKTVYDTTSPGTEVMHDTSTETDSVSAPVRKEASVGANTKTGLASAPVRKKASVGTNTETDLATAPVRNEASVGTNTEMDSVSASVRNEASVGTNTETDSVSAPVRDEASVGTNTKTNPVKKLSRSQKKKMRKKKQKQKEKEKENLNNSITTKILQEKDSLHTFTDNVSVKKQNDCQNATQTNSLANFQMANGKNFENEGVKFPLEGLDLTKTEGDLLFSGNQSGSPKYVNSKNNILSHETVVVVPYHQRNRRKLSDTSEVKNFASGQVLEDIVMREASGNSLECQPACKDSEKITKMKNSQENTSGHSLTKHMSMQLGGHLEQENRDKVGEIQIKMQDASHGDGVFYKSSSDPKDKTSYNVFGNGTHCKHLEQKNMEAETKMEDIFPPPHLGLVKDDAAIVGTGKEDNLLQALHSSPKRACIGHSRKKLLVLDVNGLLADIVACPRKGYKADIIVSRKAVFKRPYCDDFLQFCFERFNIGVWSSRVKKNVEKVIEFLMGDLRNSLLFCWDASHCSNTGHNTIENNSKPLVLKELKKLWEKLEPDLPWEKGEYNETNTLLLDDSPYKALRNPAHTAIFPYSYAYTDENDMSLGPGGDLRVYLEGLAVAENVQEYVQQHPFGQRSITESNPSWGFYSKVISIESGQTHDDGNASLT